MKVNTDGVLLGAIAATAHPRRILDIGTGTGVIALMLAQRFPLASVDAIEIDVLAAQVAGKNFQGSPFADRVASYAVAMADFETGKTYDLIVSNPPYFLHSLKNHDKRKQVARHTDMSFFSQLLARAAQWLAPDGSLQLVLPIPLAEQIATKAISEYKMGVQWAIDIRSFDAHPPVRRILAIGKSANSCKTYSGDNFVIYQRKGVYSPAYRELLQDFFLSF
ncbi:tRNA1(Val) (adenine(37)-N6)-methyltransferase [Parapedobacter deserti]|uniref:tRNA1(Val) (Adenine(37)-N6)-methyltransferase n=2 Tax=Parapedobacter deserti TaxID=1912957 RepID=A0ABV7JM21_9SPHI